MTTMTDAELIAAIQRKEVAAVGALVERYERSLINYFYRLSWDRQLAEDCAQEVFLRLYSHLDGYEPQAKFTTFLYTIARNLWIDRQRSPKQRAKVMSLDESFPMSDETPSPMEIVTRQETEKALHRAIDQLPEE